MTGECVHVLEKFSTTKRRYATTSTRKVTNHRTNTNEWSPHQNHLSRHKFSHRCNSIAEKIEVGSGICDGPHCDVTVHSVRRLFLPVIFFVLRGIPRPKLIRCPATLGRLTEPAFRNAAETSTYCFKFYFVNGTFWQEVWCCRHHRGALRAPACAVRPPRKTSCDVLKKNKK